MMGVGEEVRRRVVVEEEERRVVGGGEDVRERSPLHEVGEGGWGGRAEEGEEEIVATNRDAFRIRVRRSGSTAVRGPMVARQPVKGASSGNQPWRGAGPGGGVMPPSKPRQNGTGSCEPSPTLSRKSSTTSPPAMRRPSLTSAPQRPTRLPVFSQYPRPLSPPTSPQQSLRPTRRFTPPLLPSPEQEQRESLVRGMPAKYTRKNSMSPNNSLVGSNKVLGSKRPASPCRPTNPKRVGSPKRGEVSRRQVSSPVMSKRGPAPRVPSPVLPNKRGPSPSQARRRSPSQARSRPPSPGGRGSRPPSPRSGTIRRNPSPSQLDPEQAEALRRRIGRARKVKLYLLQQSGSNSFLVADQEKNQKYKVNIGPQTCSCNKGPGCLHILFIMLRVFGIPENDIRLTARELKEFEIEALFRAHEERKKTRVLRSRAQSMEQLETGQGGRDVSEEDSHCPICLNDMDPDENLAQCSCCNNSLHHHCMSIWMAECSKEGETALCPLCRSPWTPHARCTGPYQHFAPAPYSPPSKQRLLPVQTSVSSPSLSSSGYSTISRTSDTLHMIEQGGCPEDIPLPRAEQIPQQHWPFASTWIQHFGRDLVACLFSRDWVKRETGLRRLAREVVKLLQTGAGQDYTERQERGWRCCADMLAMMIEDKVYKVYLAAVKTLRALLNFLSCQDEAHLNSIKSQLRPLIQSVLIKCADSNRRVSEVSTDFLFEMCRGEGGDMALGKYSGGCKVQGGLGGLEFLLHIVLEERDMHSVSWQWVMGRLVLLERLLTHLPQDFSLETKTAQVNFQRLMIIIDFTFQQLGSTHLNISKLARKVFVLAAKNTAADNTTFSQVWELLGALEPTLQIRIRKKLTSAIEEAYQGLGSGSTNSSVDPREARTPQEQDRSAFLEKFLNECSNQHTEYGQSKKGWRPPLLRSSSHSPSRQPLPSRSASQSPSRAFPGKPQIKKGLCQSVINVNTQSNGYSAKLRANCTGLNKPRVLNRFNRLNQVQQMQDLATEILPTPPSLAFLMETSRNDTTREQPDSSWNESIKSDKSNAIKKSTSLTKVQVGSRTCSPQKPAREEPAPATVRSPPSQKKRSLVSSTRRLTPPSSPHIGRECKDAVDYEESMALALALSKSLYLETPLSVIPGLSAPASQEVLAHPHRDMVEDGQTRREYAEGVDWTKSSVLGTGAYSTCYQARDVQTGTLMAAKQITFLRNSEEEQERVEQLIREEVLLISKLQHPHIVRMYGAIQEGAHINVFVEWMPGGSLASLLDKHGVFHEPVLLRYLHQTLLGLDYLHSNGILHRDLKGANVLVDTSGHHLRIADFGAAARMMSKSTVPGEFQGQLQGTIAFMAPEVLRGDNYGRSCDIWSLGCLIIEMATGKPPWGASDVSNHLALIFRIACANEPPTVPDTLSPALKDLTLRCLELDPDLRPSARELLLHPVFHDL